MAMPMTWTPASPCCAWMSFSSGISRRQGAHQVAQKLITRSLPSQSARVRVRPVRSGRLKSPVSACAALARISAAVRSAGPVAGLSGGSSKRDSHMPAATETARTRIIRTRGISVCLCSHGGGRRGDGQGRMGGELVGGHETHHLVGTALLAVRSEEYDRGRSEDAEVLQQRLVLRIVRGHVRLQQDDAVELRMHLGVAEGVLLHLLAG